MSNPSMAKLGELKRGQVAKIIAVGDNAAVDDVTQRLMEIGLIENSQVEVVHEAPFGGDPIAIRVRGALIALRRAEANRVRVEIVKQS